MSHFPPDFESAPYAAPAGSEPAAGNADAQGNSETDDAYEPYPQPRRRWLPQALLFLVTCLSTFFAGACRWMPSEMLSIPGQFLRQSLLAHWHEGLLYTACVVAILLTHEMGHFLAALWYRVPASWPYFLPLPISPIGTLGAVIAMDGRRANRREIFDIGIAGPLAGLVVAIPILWLGVQQVDFSQTAHGSFAFELPLLIQFFLALAPPAGLPAGHAAWLPVGQMNPLCMAGWVGLLITGLNMMPVSQLDGGHVLHGLAPRRAPLFARTFLLAAIVYVVLFDALHWLLMLGVIVLLGVDHPRTADDTVPLGPFRTVLGYASWLIPVLCFPPHVIRLLG